MKKLLIILLLLVCSLQAQFKNFSYTRLDTLLSRVDTNGTGVQIRDNVADTLLPLQARVLLVEPSATFDWGAGKIGFDPEHLTLSAGTGIQDVSIQIGQELQTLTYNNSGALINNGKFVFASGVDLPSESFTIELADASNAATSSQILGAVTHDCPDGTMCLVTYFGDIHDVPTDTLTPFGPLYLGTNGGATNVQPLYPQRRLIVGGAKRIDPTEGIIYVNLNSLPRNDVSKSYTFTSQGISSGTYWKAGYYDFATTSFALNEGSTNIQYGQAGAARGAHFAIVAAGPGTATGGVVGLRVDGVCDYEDGRPQALCLDTIVNDITTLQANTYYETPGKFSSDPTLQTFTFSGTPTSWAVGVNYGFAKYDDLQDRDYTITGLECIWQGNANANTLDIELLHHSQTGWTFAASGFVPGNGSIAHKDDDMQLAGEVWNNVDGAWKRSNLDYYIAGQTGEGHVIKITTGGTNTVQIKDCHVKAVSEELNF